MCNPNTNLNVKLLSLNVRGLNSEKKRRSIFNFVRKNKVDICFLQECYSVPEVENQWKCEWGGDALFAHGSNHSRGVIILFKPKLDVIIHDKVCDVHGRYIWLDISLQGEHVQLLNIYAPNVEQSQIRFFTEIKHLLGKQRNNEQKLLIGGDLNLLFNPSIDRKRKKFCEDKNV